MKKINKTLLFLILTFAISFAVAGIYRLFGGPGTATGSFTILGVLYMFIPTLAVLIVKKVVHREPIKTDLLVSFKFNRWFLFAWLSMPLIIFCTVGVNLLFPGVNYDPEMEGFFRRLSSVLPPEQLEEMRLALQELPVDILWLTLIQGLIAGITINALAAFFEELAWRGFLLNAFRNMHFLKAALVIGLIWGIWHAPLILMGHNYPQHPVAGVLMMIVLCLLLTPFLLYVTIKARSVIAAAVMHGTMNAVAGVSFMAINGGNDLTSGITGLAGFITLSLFLIMLIIYDSFISRQKILFQPIERSLENDQRSSGISQQ